MYYDGSKLLSLQDLDGRRPELFLCTTNRTGGKTTWFSRYLVKRFLEHGEKFMLIYRFSYEIDNVHEEFFKDIKGLFFRQHEMTSKKFNKGLFSALYLDGEHCGYAVYLNSADTLKKMSHLFTDVSHMFMDEFQSETNHYCFNEIKKFISIHTSVARGNNKMTRYVPVYMCANTVTLLNPYYAELGIPNRLRDNTKFLRGHGFALEQGYVPEAAEAMKESGFMQAFSNSSYVNYAREAVYLNDSDAFIERPNGKCSRYLFNLRYKGKDFGVKEYMQDGYIYCSKRVDKTFPLKFSVTVEDHQVNYVLLQRNEMMISNMRVLFNNGCYRFQDLESKQAIMDLISYR